MLNRIFQTGSYYLIVIEKIQKSPYETADLVTNVVFNKN